MKKSSLFVLCMFLSIVSVFCDEMLFSLDEAGLGGVAGPDFRFTWFGDDFAVIGGAPLLIETSEKIRLGAYIAYPEGPLRNADMIYGGTRFDYKFLSFSVLDFFGTITAGLGYIDDGNDYGVFLVSEPAFCIDLGILHSLRLAIGAGFRAGVFLDPVPGFNNMDLNAPFFYLHLEEGLFPSSRALSRHNPDGNADFYVSGFWSGRVSWYDGKPVYLDGGGTRAVLFRHFSTGPFGMFMKGANLDTGLASVSNIMEIGAWSEYLVNPDDLLQLSIALPIGYTMLNYRLFTKTEWDMASGFFISPTVNASLRVTEFIKLTIGVGYRFIPGLNMSTAGIGNMGGPLINLQVRLGGFYE